TTLTDVISQCFDNSTDGRFAEPQRALFLAEGKRLRGLLLNLLSAQFATGTPEVLNANAELKAVNTDLKTSLVNLSNTATTVGSVAHLVGTLDGFLNAAVIFV